MKNKVTLKELSKLLNVSVSTVSKALNDSSEISQKTIDRVKEVAALHHYRPNPTAVNLKSSKSGTIAVIVPNISNAFFAKVMSGIEEEAQKRNLQVITYISNESYEREKQILDMVSSGFVDGALIAPSEETQKMRKFDHLAELLEYEIPFVLYDRINFDIPVDKVGVDDEGSFYEATRLFCDHGVDKIGLVSAIRHLDVGKLRIDGYKRAMDDKNLEIIASEDVDELRKGISSIFKKGVKAIICTDIFSTILTSRVAYEQKITIPEELKLIGYINEDVAPYVSPSLSYIDQHPRKIGEVAIDLLVAKINKERKEEQPVIKIIKTDLVHLESTKF